MRYAKIVLPALVVITLFSCEKDDYYWGTVTVQKNGSPWVKYGHTGVLYQTPR